MGSKNWLFLLSASLVLSSASSLFEAASAATTATSTSTATSSAATKTKKKAHHTRTASTLLAARRGSRNVFVPPPPAYMPSILPELQYPQMASRPVDVEAEAKPENPYSKYIYTADPNKAPTIVQPGKYVTVWNKT